ncbi:MAG: hypothetical protein CMM52_16225 [Rhodospirillaceae bacterium]|nr:hypothetical protein [Rhodospirillaceae bacterium]|tara:strand:- start:8454 stop:8879 length:426 start_codon:yes stop_codon:yes gene_type:complete
MSEELQEALNLAGDAVSRAADGTVQLVGSECGECGKNVFPPTDVCPQCMSENLSSRKLSAQGKLYSWSVVHAAPKGWDLPFIAAYVDLPEEVRVFAHIVDADPEALEMEMPVEARIAVLGSDESGTAIESYAFTPVTKGDS